MYRRPLWTAAKFIFSMLIVAGVLPSQVSAQAEERVIYSFVGGVSDGAQPQAGLVLDKENALYGTTAFGGSNNCNGGCGVVFQLSPVQGGGWTESIIYDFLGANDGYRPFAQLALDKEGNLYGTTIEGGAYGGGVVFKLTRSASGGWTQSTLHTFGNGTDGNEANGPLVFDAAGNIYGTTYAGGTGSAGIVFVLRPTGVSSWAETILYNFTNGTNGGFSNSGVILDAAGNVYGTTSTGGAYSQGVVFELTRASGWAESVLHSFNPANDGYDPSSGLIFDAAGNLYGMTRLGAGSGYGTVYELSPASGGSWTESVLYSFSGGNDGRWPTSGVIFDSAGNLYGTTTAGGSHAAGVVFELTPAQGDLWTYSLLHTFYENGTDGATPDAGLVIDNNGDLYGTTYTGGSDLKGTVFEVRP